MRAASEDCTSHAETFVEISYIHPNLVHLGYVDVGFKATGDTTNAHMQLYSVNGSEIAQFLISADDFLKKYIRINTASLPIGTYVVTLWNGKLKSSSKFVVY